MSRQHVTDAPLVNEVGDNKTIGRYDVICFICQILFKNDINYIYVT